MAIIMKGDLPVIDGVRIPVFRKSGERTEAEQRLGM